MKTRNFQKLFGSTNFPAIGYSDFEVEKIERLFDVVILGQLRSFLKIAGKSSGGFLNDNFLLYQNIGLRRHFLAQLDLYESLQDIGEWELVRNKPFLIEIEFETQYYFTLSNEEGRMYIYDDERECATCLGMDLYEFIEKNSSIGIDNFCGNILEI